MHLRSTAHNDDVYFNGRYGRRETRNKLFVDKDGQLPGRRKLASGVKMDDVENLEDGGDVHTTTKRNSMELWPYVIMETTITTTKLRLLLNHHVHSCCRWSLGQSSCGCDHCPYRRLNCCCLRWRPTRPVSRMCDFFVSESVSSSTVMNNVDGV